MAEKILIVEDEVSLQETLAYNLERQGYEVAAVGDGEEAIHSARNLSPDLILLDIMLPTLDGFEVCRTLRQEMQTPIIFLSARDGEIDRVLGLELGGDDYVVKPFSMRELMARVKARLRVARPTPEKGKSSQDSGANQAKDAEMFTFGNLAIDLMRHEIRLDGEPVPVKPKAFDLLVFLAKNRRRGLTREAIINEVWGWDFAGTTRTVDVHVSWLREKIEEDPAEPKFIVTVRGLGYRFEG